MGQYNYRNGFQLTIHHHAVDTPLKWKKPITFYRAEVYIKGVRVSARNFSVKREALLWHEQEKNKFTISPTSLNDQMLFKNCVDEFCKDAKFRLTKSTYQKYECQLTYLYSSPLIFAVILTQLLL